MQHRKLTLLSSLGAGLEYYDFVIYALLGHYLSTLFFPNHQQATALISVFAVFALGYIVRPIGGIIFGILGDRYGRKLSFTSATLILALSTVSIGLLPVYANIGLSATICLVILRLIQGIAFGAELPGTLTFIVEHVNAHERGLHCGILIASVGIGASLASLIIYLLSLALSDHAMLHWGWRIPFLLGGILAYVGFIIRKYATETPLFEANRQQGLRTHPFITLFCEHKTAIVSGLSITLFAASLVIFVLYLPSYLKAFYRYNAHDLYLATTVSLLWCSFILPIVGFISDQIGRKKLLILTSVGFIISSYYFFHILELNNPAALFSFMIIYETFIAIFAICYFTTLPELFPTTVRYTGVAFCYNIAYSFAGLTPSVLTYIVSKTQQTGYVTLFFSLLASLTLLAATRLPNQRFQSLT
ncbi:MAG: MFS transporter [Gammaproteobacteria bacterium]